MLILRTNRKSHAGWAGGGQPQPDDDIDRTGEFRQRRQSDGEGYGHRQRPQALPHQFERAEARTSREIPAVDFFIARVQTIEEDEGGKGER
jgi:hypothetical protein